MEELPHYTPKPNGTALPIDEGFASEAHTPEKLTLTREGLAKRDREAVAYSKDLLVEGDTLVYISYPGDGKCFDSTGFEISAGPHRVRSGRLLATGSKVFAELLGPTNQYRTIRRKKLLGNLPYGIKYVLDLTPPDEGDEAVELTSELSCSLGVRLWYKSSSLCGVSRNLVGGEDEVLATPKTLSSASDPTLSAINGNGRAGTWDDLEGQKENNDIEAVVQLSLDELAKSKLRKARIPDLVNVPEYCPVRHRAGIARLLKILEGKDPRLDSAPKVWTLFVLAKYFDCTTAVVDWIVTWIMTDPNTQFVEILPEVSCRMAFGLKNYMLCRAAFSILVSEEALSLSSREIGRTEADRRGTNQFGRIREDIDEDLRTRIEYASKNFASRVCGTFESLTKDGTLWATQLPEYQKLQRFRADVLSGVGDKQQAAEWVSKLDELMSNLLTHIHSRLIATLNAPLSPEQSIIATSHRHAERYTSNANSFDKLSDKSFTNIYDKLHDRERIFTRFFWTLLLHIDFPIWFHGLPPSDSIFDVRNAYLSGVWPDVKTLLCLQDRLNTSIIEAIDAGVFNDGIMPLETVPFYTSQNLSLPNTSGIRREGGDVGSDSDWDALMDLALSGVDWATSDIGHSAERPELDIMNVDKCPSQGHHSDPVPGTRTTPNTSNATLSICGLSITKPSLPIRPKVVPPAPERGKYFPSGKDSGSSQAAGYTQAQATCGSSWTADISGRIKEMSQPRRDGKPFRDILPKLSSENSASKDRAVLLPMWKSSVRITVPSDNNIPAHSPFFNMTQYFLEVKAHIRDIATAMLDTREMGFDVTLTDTLLCLGSDEFKYLPLWAGGDDDDSGGVFDDTIPVAIAGPSGPGPSFHTGFSSASAASSEFDTMSERASFNTSVAVEDGYSDHIDRRRVIADDDFHSETFSEDSEVYDRKGKGVDRSGFYTSGPNLGATSSVANDTTSNSTADANFEMEFEVDNSDCDTTVGQVDYEDEDESWDGGDTESFDFGDSDEEMGNA